MAGKYSINGVSTVKEDINYFGWIMQLFAAAIRIGDMMGAEVVIQGRARNASIVWISIVAILAAGK